MTEVARSRDRGTVVTLYSYRAVPGARWRSPTSHACSRVAQTADRF